MTFYSILPGDPAVASYAMANWRHVGRLGAHFYPYDTNGALVTDGSLDLGASADPWGNLYLASTKKIYIGGVEFKGGGGGGALSSFELKTNMEKTGNDYPISDDNGLNESFYYTDNVVLTPRVAYASGTTLIADLNKTDIDLCNATTGWTAGKTTGTSATMSQDTTNKVEGSGSIKCAVVSVSDLAYLYKDLTAFSLLENIITCSIYLYSKPAGLTSLDIKLGSTAGGGSNYKTFRILAANLSTGWNHISVDPNNDTVQATNGTYVIGATSHFAVLANFNTSTSVDFSVDYLVYSPNWTLPLPYKAYIYDATNQEILKISAVAGVANYQRVTYTITALSNAYAVGSSYCKDRPLSISGNQGAFPAGLSGAAALSLYDITWKWMNSNLSGKTLMLSQNYWDEEFKVSTLSSTTVTKLSSATDKSGYFKSGDLVFLFYKKKINGRKWGTRYNSTPAKNFILLTLSADATYASSEITLTHSSIVNSGADTTDWYAVRYSAEMLYLLEDSAANGNLNTLTPTNFALGKNYFSFSDIFSVTPNNWGVLSILNTNPAGTNQISNVTGGVLYSVANSTNSSWAYTESALYRNYENYLRSKLPVRITVKFKLYYKNDYGNDGIRHQVVYGSNLANNAGAYTGSNAITDGISVTIAQGTPAGGNYIYIYNNNTLVATLSATLTQSVDYWLKIEIYPDIVKVRYWLASGSEGATWDLVGSANYTLAGNYFALVHQLDATGYYQSASLTNDDLLVQSIGGGYFVSGTVDSQSGNKLYTGTKLTRRDSTNQAPVVYSRDCALT